MSGEPVPQPSPEASAPPAPSRSAGFPRRAVATLLDMALLCGTAAAAASPFLPPLTLPRTASQTSRLLAGVANPAWRDLAGGVAVLGAGLWLLYFAVGWGMLGATPGKWAVGLRVVDYRERCPIGLARAVLRLAAYSVSSLTLGAGHLLILARTDGRALHDLLAGTRVVRRLRPAPAPRPPQPCGSVSPTPGLGGGADG